MTKRNIKIEDYANDIVKALPKGILLTTKADTVAPDDNCGCGCCLEVGK